MAFPYLWALPPNPGVLSYTAVQRGVPAVGAEVTGMGGCLDADVELYIAALRRILALMGVLPASERDPAGPQRPDTIPIWRGDWQLSPTGGLFCPRVRLGQPVAPGDLLATIHNPFGQEQGRLTAEYHGRVLALRHLRSISPGEWAVMVLTDQAEPVA